ncbi:MAG: indole-3-glycerol phosphate synthase [Phycisphaerae bacterium]|nr:indole-3-glycerol phosphate synthase [Phycisphaerae bacterium]HBZ97736.1 indole-3-glycerol-phosphate synthase TrpC [Phycisphaerales bacterium]
MPVTLEAIAERTRETVAAAQRERPIEVVQERAADSTPPRSLYGVMTREDGATHVIAECKRRSPSAGSIRDDFDAVDIALQYENAGATGISCLTDGPFFGGSLEDLTAIRGAVELPVLRKDFLVDPYQIWEARAAGADAVLLIAELLDAPLLDELVGIADSLGMTCLIELHGIEQLDKVLAFAGEGRLVGINNRNLRTMRTDIRHVTSMLEDLADHLPSVVCESGIRSHADVTQLRSHGIRNFLVGESLLKQEHPGTALRTLLGESE